MKASDVLIASSQRPAELMLELVHNGGTQLQIIAAYRILKSYPAPLEEISKLYWKAMDDHGDELVNEMLAMLQEA